MLKRNKIGTITSKVKGNTLHLEQVFPASRDIVYRAFTDADLLAKWWGPTGWGLSHSVVDLKPGGAWHFCLKCQDEKMEAYGQESWGKAIYISIDEPHKIVYRDCFSDAEGNINEELPETIITLTFDEQARFTKVHSAAEFPTKEELDTVLKMGLVLGITQTWSKLDQLLRSPS